MFFNCFIVYLLLINLIGVVLCIKDKCAARKGNWRIKESTLIFLCVFGASVGVYACMKLIRHKTKHKKFMIGIPIIIILQLILSAFAILHI